MILFEKVRYQNFLAAGNVPIEIGLNTHASTLIVGRNGAGKSTMTEAVCFALFGRALRNINKPALVNSVNKRDALVELWFRVGGSSYQVRRGIKPNLFEIYQDGVLIPAPAAIADYQTILETQILGLNYKSFMQIVVLGSASYVPFMRLTPAARRDIIEDILDIEVFSAMNALAKDELTQLRSRQDILATERRLLDEQYRLAESFQSQMVEQQDAQLAAIREEIAREEARLDAYEGAIVQAQAHVTAYQESIDGFDDVTSKLTSYTNTKNAIVSRVKKLQKERDFYTSHDQCPTCTQSITEDFKQDRYTALHKKEQDASYALTRCEELIQKYSVDVDTLQDLMRDRDAAARELHQYQAQASLVSHRLRELRAQVSAPAPAKTVADLHVIRENIETTTQEQQTLSERRTIVETAASLLKDTGIKSRIIKHYLPIINKHINYYLSAMDFPIHFTLDENFEEQIQSRHRDDFSYESFSEGEKKRIDLALLLTWRAVAKLKNSASCNMLVLDEVFDSSLDVAGTEEFLKIIHALEDANVFVISHKTDSLIDKFAHVLHFVKERGFSSLRK